MERKTDRKPQLGNAQQDKDLGSNKKFNSPLEMKQSITLAYITLHITYQGRQHEKKYKTRPVKIKYKVKTGTGAVI